MVIVGVVSALVIPSVLANYQKRQFLIKLKSTYSILQNAKLRAEVDYGPMKNWEVTSSNYFEKYVKPYLKVEKTNKVHAMRHVDGTEQTDWYGDPFRHNSFQRYFLPNGVEISVNGTYSCELTPVGRNQYCIINIDLNGPKMPNVCGKDIHAFAYYYNRETENGAYRGKILPHLYWYYNDAQLKDMCMKTGDNVRAHRYCTDAVFKNNWQYPDWYPW